MLANQRTHGEDMSEVAPGVYQVGGGELSSPGDCCVYLVDAGDGRSVLIDAGLSTDPTQLLANIEATGHDPKRILAVILTHGHIDHIGGAQAIKWLTGCEVVAHEGDVAAIREGDPLRTASDLYCMGAVKVEVDRVLEGDGAVLEYGTARLVVVHTPGHTPGDITLLLKAGGRTVLFANDVHGPFSADWGSDTKAWARSMNRLVAMAPDVLLEGHFGAIAPRARAVEFIQQYLSRPPAGV